MEANLTNLLYGLLGGIALISLVAIIGGFLQCRRERIFEHRERMKALELGHEMPDDAATARIKAAFGAQPGTDNGDEGGSLARKCFSTTLWVAFWGFIAAAQAGTGNHPVAIAIAGAVGAVGVAGMICGTILAFRTPARPAPGSVSKPVIDADAFDVVSCRS
jgi:hypothetical protein